MLIVTNNIWPLHKGWLLPNKWKWSFCPSVRDSDDIFCWSGYKISNEKNPPLRQGWLLPWRRGEIPDGGVALTQGEELKFLAGINHNTPFVFLHDINIMYDINSLQGIALAKAHSVWSSLRLLSALFRWAASFWHLSNIDSLSSLKLLKASEIANCCVWQLHVYRTDPQCCCSRLWPLILIVTLVQSLFHSVP